MYESFLNFISFLSVEVVVGNIKAGNVVIQINKAFMCDLEIN